MIGLYKGIVFGRNQEANNNSSSKKKSRSILGGLFSEQVAPFLDIFPVDLKASEARFIGKPVDFIVFKGLDEQNITEVVFVEVKSGKSQLTTNERSLEKAIKEKHVDFKIIRIDKKISTLELEENQIV